LNISLNTNYNVKKYYKQLQNIAIYGIFVQLYAII